MKRKFYDIPPEPESYDDGYYWADSKDYQKEINYIAKKEGLDVKSFRVDDMTFDYEPVVFVNGKYWGYLDRYFYLELEHGIEIQDYEYWDRFEEYKNNC